MPHYKSDSGVSTIVHLGFGDIAVTRGTDPDGPTKEVGAPVRLRFERVESIDVVLEQLLKLRSEMVEADPDQSAQLSDFVVEQLPAGRADWIPIGEDGPDLPSMISREHEEASNSQTMYWVFDGGLHECYWAYHEGSHDFFEVYTGDVIENPTHYMPFNVPFPPVESGEAA